VAEVVTPLWVGALVQQGLQGETPETASDDEVWVAMQVGALLSAPDEVSATWTPEALRDGIRALVHAAYGGSVVRASRLSGQARASVCTWVRGKGRPNLSSLVQLCHHARADVVELLGGRYRSTGAEADVNGAATMSLLNRTYKRLAIAPGHVLHCLRAATREEPPPNVAQFARRFDMSPRCLRERWPAAVKELVDVSARYREGLNAKRLLHATTAYEHAAQELVRQNKPVTKKVLQRSSGIVAFSQNTTRVRALQAVVAALTRTEDVRVGAEAS
jgi:hypothetical protein